MLCLKFRHNISKYCSKTIYHRRLLYYQYEYNSKIEELINKQIQAEQQAAQEYLNIAVTFLHSSKSLFGAGGFFMKMYHEEIKHMLDFIHYQLLRGGKPVLCCVKQPVEIKSLTLIDAFKQGLVMEKGITKQIEELIKVAEDLNDRHCADFLTSVFLAEQIQSIHEMANHVTRLIHLGNSEDAGYYYDLKLMKVYPYSLKII